MLRLDSSYYSSCDIYALIYDLIPNVFVYFPYGCVHSDHSSKFDSLKVLHANGVWLIVNGGSLAELY